MFLLPFVKSLVYKGILKVLCRDELWRHDWFRGSIIAVGVDILPDVSLLIVERELHIPLRPVPSRRKLGIGVGKV